MGTRWLRLSSDGFERVVELVRNEDAPTSSPRGEGLKAIERAVGVLREVFEAAVAFAAPGASSGDAAAAVIMRLELYTFVAVDLLRADRGQEFGAWARRAQAAAEAAAPYVRRPRAPSATPRPSAEIILSAAEYARVVDLIDHPPAPSARLRKLLGRRR